MKKDPILYFVIPCYNEEEVLPKTAPIFSEQLNLLISKNLISPKSRILFVNDGSSDTTWDIIKKLSNENPQFSGISLSHNRGHQNAVAAGLLHARTKCDIAISADCDGQDDIRVTEEMVSEYQKGNDIVYGVRKERKKDTFFKRFTAQLFYKTVSFLGGEIVYNHADYRLTSRRVLDEFANYTEVNIFLRGMFPMIGFKNTIVYYDRTERLAGKSHYPLKKMLALAADGITSLSIKPIRLITSFGIVVSGLSFLGILWAIFTALFKEPVSGWASLICIICFFSGVQILSIGIVGEYIGKTYLEAKHRPRYCIEESLE